MLKKIPTQTILTQIIPSPAFPKISGWGSYLRGIVMDRNLPEWDMSGFEIVQG